MNSPFLRIGFAAALGVFTSVALCQAAALTFPQGYVPFTSLDYQTFPDQDGYSLVVGEAPTLAQIQQLFNYLISLPPISGDQLYANEPIELAPGMFFNNVLVPTSAERRGEFRDFGGALYDPLTFYPCSTPQFPINYGLPQGCHHPFPGNLVPYSRLYELYAFRLAPASGSAVPEPGGFVLVAIGLMIAIIYRAATPRERPLNRVAALRSSRL